MEGATGWVVGAGAAWSPEPCEGVSSDAVSGVPTTGLVTMGAGAVGMSTVHEAIALNAMGARVCGLSLISNQAAGISPDPLDHAEVIAVGKQAAARLTQLVLTFCGRLAAES